MTDRELLELVVGQLEKMDHRFDRLEGKIDSMEHRMDSMEHKIDSMEHRMDSIEHKIDILQENTGVTREAVNSIIEWTDEVAVITQIKFPISKIS